MADIQVSVFLHMQWNVGQLLENHVYILLVPVLVVHSPFCLQEAITTVLPNIPNALLDPNQAQDAILLTDPSQPVG